MVVVPSLPVFWEKNEKPICPSTYCYTRPSSLVAIYFRPGDSEPVRKVHVHASTVHVGASASVPSSSPIRRQARGGGRTGWCTCTRPPPTCCTAHLHFSTAPPPLHPGIRRPGPATDATGCTGDAPSRMHFSGRTPAQSFWYPDTDYG